MRPMIGCRVEVSVLVFEHGEGEGLWEETNCLNH
jgi:hypothetical protein